MVDWSKKLNWTIVGSLIGFIVALILLVRTIVYVVSLPDFIIDSTSKNWGIMIEVFSILMSVIFGSVVGGGIMRYYVGKKLQELRFAQDKELEKLKWAREDLKEMVDEVYNPLYLQIANEIIPQLEKNPFSSKVFF